MNQPVVAQDTTASVSSRNDTSTETEGAVIFGKKLPIQDSRSISGEEGVTFGRRIPDESRSISGEEGVTFGRRIPDEPTGFSNTNKASEDQTRGQRYNQAVHNTRSEAANSNIDNNPMPMGSQNQNVSLSLFPAYSQPAGSNNIVVHTAYPGTSNDSPEQISVPDGFGFYSQLLPAKSFKKMCKTFGNPTVGYQYSINDFTFKFTIYK